MKRNIAAVLAGGLLFGMGVAAAGFAADNDPHILQREVNQQDRINQGMKSGQLTPGEAAKLERQQTRINQREERMTAMDNGQLTKQDKKKLTREQNRASRDIYRLKHNQRKAPTGT